MCVEAELARGDLRELRIRQMQIERHLYLVYRQDRPLSAAARGLVETILSKKKRRPSSGHREHSKAKAQTSAKTIIGR
jgi:DNA-binding transcriptional LysR family regulator